VVVNDRAVRVPLCRTCAAELDEVLAPYLNGAHGTRWPVRAPYVGPDGAVWQPSEVRLVLSAVDRQAPSVGSLGPRDLASWHSLYKGDRATVAELRAAAKANPAAAKLILERILAARGE
jgi:hypothetical protein